MVSITPKSIPIGKLLAEDLILIRPSAADKMLLLETLVDKLCSAKGLSDGPALLKKVVERERGISTTLDTGLSLPHARADSVPDIAAILGLLPEGIPDPKHPDLKIRAMFLFFSPNKQETFNRHLHLLRDVSAMFQPEFIDELLACPSAEKVLALIRGKEAAA